MDEKTTVQEMKLSVKKFQVDRNWQKFQTFKDAALKIFIEMGELSEHLCYFEEGEIAKALENKEKFDKVSDELGDVVWNLLLLSDKLNIDLSAALARKLEKTAAKYPVEKVKDVGRESWHKI